MCITPASIDAKDKIDLTEKEKLIFDCLLQVVQHFNLPTQIRVAGGWVRDKLLGKECHDIDIAVDDMSGVQFCEKVNEYLQSIGKKTHDIGVSLRNPDQSKHLETAVVKLFDVSVDVVNLRSEDYSENSRIPTMRFGSAEEDAYRRDLTINSLFYNINTSSVEDLTGRGIADLKSGKIVTPLPPKQTFLDDPLRVLRAIRFGNRQLLFGLLICILQLKFLIICQLKKFKDLFSSVPPSVLCFLLLCVTYMDSVWRILHLVGCSSFNGDQQRLCLYAALLLPFRSAAYRDKKDRMVVSLHLAAEKFVSLIPLIMSKDDLQFPEADWKRETIDVPIASKIRILAGLDKVWELKPVVDGRGIMHVLQLNSGGPVVREWQDKVVEWQLAHPSGSTTECTEWMRQTLSKRTRTE
ncbi:CCA tRNA nucleotidyltransferase, mitochondrial [Sesamum angolense]|uniref:CCA tRNA nucleotidyltransferase, mitochondrial n=1 Tax=Sesamum angolense TaxID=2727404 RepID=A0AAE2BNE4_9LAMI|nr:CCA tRNA nucleotidyltransferase, mitochondrial [Sesamum angolense]